MFRSNNVQNPQQFQSTGWFRIGFPADDDHPQDTGYHSPHKIINQSSFLLSSLYIRYTAQMFDD